MANNETDMTGVYKVKGTTNDVTTCEQCGRDELKGTVVLQPLDQDGNPDGHAFHFGTSCVAKAAGWTQRDVTARVKTAKNEERERQAAERAAIWERRRAFLACWHQEHYGTPDLHKAAELANTTTWNLSAQAISAYRAHQSAR